MSEMGPMRVRSRRRWRMISWPAANGMSASRPSPRATDEPSVMASPTASYIDMSLDFMSLARGGDRLRSFVRELRHPLLNVGVEAFLRVLALEEQLLQFALGRKCFGERHVGARLH